VLVNVEGRARAHADNERSGQTEACMQQQQQVAAAVGFSWIVSLTLLDPPRGRGCIKFTVSHSAPRRQPGVKCERLCSRPHGQGSAPRHPGPLVFRHG
jgi:hypothetical protein